MNKLINNISNKDGTHDVMWNDDIGTRIGYGYQTEDKVIHIMKCPECKKENYALQISQGPCCWCGFEG